MPLTQLTQKKNLIAFTAIAIVGTVVPWTFGRSAATPTRAAPPPIPVVVANVGQRDVPHLTVGIAAVESMHSVTIRPRIDGMLVDVPFQEGQLINQGDLLARLDDRAITTSLDQARAEKARNEAQLTMALLDLNRYNNLLKEEAISKQAIDQQTAVVNQLKATIRANDATIAAAEVQLSYTRITSPVNGRAGIRRIDSGNLVRASDSEGLVTITQIDPISVTFSLPQELLPRIQQAMRNQSGALVTALDRDGGTTLGKGTLSMIDNQINATTGTIRLKAKFPNKDGKLWPGQFVTVQLTTGLSANALVVPKAAVQRGLDKLFVYRVKDGKVEAAPVLVSYEDNEVAVIGSGLTLGDTVVRDGQSRLKPGVAVVSDAPKPALAEKENKST